MKEVVTAGGVIVEGDKVLLIRHRGGGLGFAKGHVEQNESLDMAALREVTEETAYEAAIVSYLGSLERRSIEKTGETVSKRIEIFKMVAVRKLPQKPEEAPEWVRPGEAIGNMQFPEEAVFLEQHIDELK